MSQRPTVRTAQGQLEGVERDGVRVFRGIPFAEPPVGQGRFRAPQKPRAWAGTRDASQPGPASLQPRGLMTDIEHFDEDCLYLNVFTPLAAGAPRPVLVWIHGGGFTSGAGSQSIYDGRHLAARGDVVVVTINYRLGALGFAALGGLLGAGHGLSANNGLRDQIAALEWVRDHIEAFGGDPGRVTVFGQSAGAMCIGSLLASPLARGLFHGAIAQSGAAHHAVDEAEALRMGEVLLGALGIGAGAGVEALWRVPAAALVEAQLSCARQTVLRGPAGGQLPQGVMTLLPSVDGELLLRQPAETIAAGEAAPVPLIAGSTLHEWHYFIFLTDPDKRKLDEAGVDRIFARRIPGAGERVVAAYRRAVPEQEPWRRFAAIEGDRMFRVPAIRMVEAQARRAPSFLYRFDHGSPLFDGAMGACHAVDLPFTFGTVDTPFGHAFAGKRPEARVLSEALMDGWLAFARSGDPSCEALGRWPRYDAQARATLRLDTRIELLADPQGAERACWDGIC
jgi:para-nitrobenzyl esterase